jgi:hypothetical protein
MKKKRYKSMDAKLLRCLMEGDFEDRFDKITFFLCDLVVDAVEKWIDLCEWVGEKVLWLTTGNI